MLRLIPRRAPPVYRPINAGMPPGFIPAGLARAVKPRVASYPNFVQPKLTIGEDDDGFIIDGSIFPPIRNRQKTTLDGLLKTLKGQKRFAGLLADLSANALKKRGVSEEQGIQVLQILDGWATNGDHPFGSWNDAVTEAAKQAGPSLTLSKPP